MSLEQSHKKSGMRQTIEFNNIVPDALRKSTPAGLLGKNILPSFVQVVLQDAEQRCTDNRCEECENAETPRPVDGVEHLLRGI